MTLQEKYEAARAETLEQLRFKDFRSAFIERIYLMNEAYDLYRLLPQPLAFGYAVWYMADRSSLPIEPHDLILGRVVQRVPTPEEDVFIAAAIQREQNGERLLNDGGHFTVDLHALIEKGYYGLREDVRAKIAELSGSASEKRLTFLRGMELVYTGFMRYAERYAEEAEKRGMTDEAEICRALTVGAPRTFRQGLQLAYFTIYCYYVFCSGSLNCYSCLNIGRLDDELHDLFASDKAAGTLTDELARTAIHDFYCKCADFLGRGEHQLGGTLESWMHNPVYDSPTYVGLGGRSALRDTLENPLTDLFLQAVDPRYEQPTIIFRYNSGLPEKTKRLFAEKVRDGASFLNYSDHAVIPAMRRIGVEENDAINYSVYPCNWPNISCCDVPVAHIRHVQGQFVTELVFDENGVPRQNFPTMQSICDAFVESYRAEAHKLFNDVRAAIPSFRSEDPQFLRATDCLFHDCIRKATWRRGAAKYYTVLVMFRSIAGGVDCLAALEKVVYQDKLCTLAELGRAIAANFEGYPELLAAVRRAPKYGDDDPAANRIGHDVYTAVTDAVIAESYNADGVQDVHPLFPTATDMFYFGDQCGATADGRLRGEPFTENMSPAPGHARSVTSVLNSALSLPRATFHSGGFNLRLPKSLVAGEEGLSRLMLLIDSYFTKGGTQQQWSFTDVEELKKAQLRPDEYRDLMVRITGYSAVFVDMSKLGQDQIIRRDDLS
ncbi:MAG: hypothetical protein KIG36_03845 [Eubacteriales bacterium]|nr:hypothetical protein [Eubacteriales bacterium]